jgi:PPOX class probable F420-dependent enzyme
MGVSSITDPEVRAFLTDGTRTGKLSFLSSGGHPLVTPVWFVLEGDAVVFNTGKDTAKGRYLARDPRVSLCVDLEVPPYAFVQVQGDAVLSEEPGELVRTGLARRRDGRLPGRATARPGPGRGAGRHLGAARSAAGRGMGTGAPAPVPHRPDPGPVRGARPARVDGVPPPRAGERVRTRPTLTQVQPRRAGEGARSQAFGGPCGDLTQTSTRPATNTW